VGDFLSRFVVVLDSHARCSVIDKGIDRLPGQASLVNQMPVWKF
jgi:hypothetical protein